MSDLRVLAMTENWGSFVIDHIQDPTMLASEFLVTVIAPLLGLVVKDRNPIGPPEMQYFSGTVDARIYYAHQPRKLLFTFGNRLKPISEVLTPGFILHYDLGLNSYGALEQNASNKPGDDHLSSCGICLSPGPLEYGYNLNCCHRFCTSCLVRWFQIRMSCPVCVHEVSGKTLYEVENANYSNDWRKNTPPLLVDLTHGALASGVCSHPIIID